MITAAMWQCTVFAVCPVLRMYGFGPPSQVPPRPVHHTSVQGFVKLRLKGLSSMSKPIRAEWCPALL